MDEIDKLYGLLKREGYYTKSYEEFINKYKNDDSYKSKIFDVVSRDGFYTKTKEDFLSKYNTTDSSLKKKQNSEVTSPVEGTVSPTEQVVEEPTSVESSAQTSESLTVEPTSAESSAQNEAEQQAAFDNSFGVLETPKQTIDPQEAEQQAAFDNSFGVIGKEQQEPVKENIPLNQEMEKILEDKSNFSSTNTIGEKIKEVPEEFKYKTKNLPDGYVASKDGLTAVEIDEYGEIVPNSTMYAEDAMRDKEAYEKANAEWRKKFMEVADATAKYRGSTKESLLNGMKTQSSTNKPLVLSDGTGNATGTIQDFVLKSFYISDKTYDKIDGAALDYKKFLKKKLGREVTDQEVSNGLNYLREKKINEEGGKLKSSWAKSLSPEEISSEISKIQSMYLSISDRDKSKNSTKILELQKKRESTKDSDEIIQIDKEIKDLESKNQKLSNERTLYDYDGNIIEKSTANKTFEEGSTTISGFNSKISDYQKELEKKIKGGLSKSDLDNLRMKLLDLNFELKYYQNKIRPYKRNTELNQNNVLDKYGEAHVIHKEKMDDVFYKERMAKFIALNNVLMLNEDPAYIARSKGAKFVGGLKSSFGLDTSGDAQQIAKVASQTLAEYGYDSEARKARTIDTFGEKVSEMTGSSLGEMTKLAAVSLVSKSTGIESAIGTTFKTMQWIATKGKYSKTLVKAIQFAEEAIPTGAKYGIAGSGVATGVGEGVAQALFKNSDKMLALGKYGKAFEFASKTVISATAETVGEYAGEFLQLVEDNGGNIQEAFNVTIGENPWEKLALTAILTSAPSALSNVSVLSKNRNSIIKVLEDAPEEVKNLPIVKQALEIEKELKGPTPISKDEANKIAEENSELAALEATQDSEVESATDLDSDLTKKYEALIEKDNQSRTETAPETENELEKPKTLMEKAKGFFTRKTPVAEVEEVSITETKAVPVGKRLFNEPNPKTTEISKRYKESKGIDTEGGENITSIDTDNSRTIADVYEDLEDNPKDPEVQKAYSMMADETASQHQAIMDEGYEIEIWEGEGEPYKNAQEMINDLKDNNHMYIFGTEAGFGKESITETQRNENKMLQDSGFKDKNGKPLLYNDVFRFVHDFFGHSERGNGFGAIGEENAWDVHSRMYSPLARRAMTTETRGQNSWVNFGPQMRGADGKTLKKGDKGYLTARERAFAPQKMALMPEWVSEGTKPEAASESKQAQQASEVQAEVESDKSSEQEVRDIEAFFKEDTDGDVQFQLASKEPAANKKTLVNKAKALMNKLMPKINSESKTVEETQAVSIPIEIKEGSRLHEMLKKTKLGAVELKDLVGKKINLVMADQLVANGKYMGGPMFPFIDSLFGRVAWASMKKGAASSIVNGAIDSDYSVVFNMSPKAVYSNKAFRKEILDSLSNEKQQELFGLIKESETKKSEKEKKAIDESKTLSELFENMNDFNVDQKINFFSKIIPSKTVNSTSGVLGFMQDNGLNLENLSNKLSDELVRDLPLGAMTVVLEVTDKKGNKITSKTKNEAIISREQQAEEGMESHPNYPIYIRGRVVGVLKETVPFWEVLPSYKEIVEKKVLGIIKARNVFSTKYEGKEAKVLEKINEDGSRDLELQVKTGKDFKSKESFNLKKSDKISTKKFIEKNIGAVSKYKEGAQASSKKARAGAYASAMKGAKRAEKVSKNVKSSYSKFVERLSKSFPSVEVVATKEEFNSLLDNLSAKALSTKNQTIYGAVYNGKLYLNPELENFNTPVHEFGHIWLNTAKEMKNNAYEKGIDLIKNSEYVDRVKNNKDYKRVTDKMKKEGATDAEINQYILEEALATAIGDKGESFATAAAERNFKNWLSDLFEFVKKLTGISGLTNEQIQNMNLDEFTQAVVVDIMSEKKLFKDSEVKKLEDALQLMTFTNDYKTMQTIINEARENNFTDAAIKDYLTRVRKFPLKEVNEEMKAKADFFIELPDSFKNMKGGIKAGQELFNKVSKFREKEVRNNKKRKNKLSEQEIVDKTIEFMESQPEFVAEGDTYTVGSKKKGTQATKMKKSPSSQQIEMLSDLQESVGTTVDGQVGVRPTKNMQEKIRKARLMLTQRKKGARDVSSVKTELRNFIRKSLPKYLYTKKEVVDLIKKVSIATQDNIDNLFQEVTEFVTQKNNQSLEKAITNILGGKYEKVESGRLKGVKVDLETKERIESIKSNLANESMTAEDIMADNDKLNAKMNEMQKNPNPTDAELNSMVDMQIVIEYNNSLLMDNRDMNKTASLDFVNNELSEIITKGRSALKQELQEAAQKYRDQRADLYEDITGERVDMDAENASETLDTAQMKRRSDAQSEKVKNRAKAAMSKIAKFISDKLFGTGEALDGLMDRISKLPGELFGGKSQVLVTEKVDESSRNFKERKMIVEAMIKTKLQDIYGKRWGKKSRNNRVKINTGIVDGFGNEIVMTPNEMAYMYNQYKDPANHPSFEATYGKDYARIMKEMENKLDSNLKEFADWQVNEFFPELYEHYNDVYKKIYRANMPWNQFYAGKIYKDGVEAEPLDLLSGNGAYNTSIGAASTKARTKNNLPIIPMDITDALASYVNDMEYFAAYAENIRYINKLFTNKYIKSAITDIHGNDIMSLINESIQKIANKGGRSTGMDKFMNGMNTVYITSRLALSPVIMIKQLTSLFTYANDIGYRNWVKYAAKNKMEQAKVWKEVRDNSVYLKDRKYDSILNTIETYKDSEMKSFVPHPAKQWATNFLMWTTKKGDIGAIMLGGLPNYSYYKSEFKKNNPKATEQQAIDYAIIKFERDTKRTQQSSDLQDKDSLQTKSAITRAMNMFLTTPKQYLRKEIQAVRSLSKKVSQWDKNAGKGSIRDNVRTLLTYHVFMPVLFQYVTAGFPGLLADWEEEDETDLLRASIIGNLNALFVIGELVNAAGDFFTDKPWAGESFKSVGILEIASSLTKKRKKFNKLKDKKKKEEALMDFWLEAGTITGLPAPTLNKMFKNYSNVGTDGILEKDILRLLNFSEYVIDGKKKTRRKRKSMSMESLRKYAPDVYEEMKKMKKISKIDID